LRKEENDQRRAKELEWAEIEGTTVEYRRHLSPWFYFPVVAVLILVEWVANVPVFQELLPQEPGSSQAWQDLVSHSEKFGSSAGLVRLWDRIVFAPDVA